MTSIERDKDSTDLYDYMRRVKEVKRISVPSISGDGSVDSVTLSPIEQFIIEVKQGDTNSNNNILSTCYQWIEEYKEEKRVLSSFKRAI